ncbi:nuclear transport factor 2 family protein [Nocardia sp. CA-135953]|uniref:nuclear transport factor 2 family protein n=1 Tax=Nocardia sp. CA-135953 TaxID=3239978 RepID=UPI003D96A375
MSHTSHPNLDLIARAYQAFDDRDYSVIPRVFDPEIEINQAAELPWGGHHHGHRGAVEFFTTLLAHIDSKVTCEHLFAVGDAVVQSGRTSGTTRTAGTAFDVPEVHVWSLREGRVVGFDAYIDTPAMPATLGAGR